MKKEIEVYDYMNTILMELKKGVLLTTKFGGQVNTMSISWGQIGLEWNTLIFTAFVRTGRHTHKMLEGNGQFTVNFPNGASVSEIIGYCGSKSGRDTDKIKDMNLTLVDGDQIDVPGIKELPLTLECEVVYKQLQDKDSVHEIYKEQFYPESLGSKFSGANSDYHTMFYGKVLKAYILE